MEEDFVEILDKIDLRKNDFLIMEIFRISSDLPKKLKCQFNF